MVCRRWNNVLSSDKFTRTALNRFDTHDPQDSALDAETYASSSHKSAIHHVLALRHGRSHSCQNISDKFACATSVRSLKHLLRLKGKHIAYLRGNPKTHEGNTVVVRDLVAGKVTSLCGTAREKIMSIELTSDIVAFFTYRGTVYIASLQALTDTPRSVRLPSSSILATSSCRTTLACLVRGSSSLIAVVHDTGVRRTHSFELQPVHGHNDDMSRCTVLLDSREQCVHVFIVRAPNTGHCLRIEVSRYSYAGARTAEASFVMQHELSLAQNVIIGTVEPTGEQGLHQIALSYGDGSSCKRWTLIYDSKMITLKAIDCFPQWGASDYRLLQQPALWKDRVYRCEGHRLRIETAWRSASHDGPHTLRNLGNEAKPELTNMVEDDEDDDNEYDVEDKQSSVVRIARIEEPMSLGPWKTSTGQGGLSIEMYHRARVKDLPSIFPRETWQPVAPGTPFGVSAFCEAPLHFHTIVAMNDTFAMGTCFNPGCIGVVCFDERVTLHGGHEGHGWHGVKP